MDPTPQERVTPTVALTYDDGPSQWTRPILDVLAANNARATFFVLGSHIHENADALRQTIQEGHEIGIHGWDHTPADLLDPVTLGRQILDTLNAIQQVAQTTVRWWRAPWHRVNGAAEACAMELGYGYCSVTIDGGDVSRSEDWVADSVIRALDNGAVIGLHDGIAANGAQVNMSRDGTVVATARILEHCRSVTVSELLA
jgi:peptidoglycan-N-acetylglucosamine deacetylase